MVDVTALHKKPVRCYAHRVEVDRRRGRPTYDATLQKHLVSLYTPLLRGERCDFHVHHKACTIAVVARPWRLYQECRLDVTCPRCDTRLSEILSSVIYKTMADAR